MQIPYFDAHCDTAFPMYLQHESLLSNQLQLDIQRMAGFAPCAQVFAVCTELSARAQQETEAVILNFLCELQKHEEEIVLCRCAADLLQNREGGKMLALLSVEGADRIGCSAIKLQEKY